MSSSNSSSQQAALAVTANEQQQEAVISASPSDLPEVVADNETVAKPSTTITPLPKKEVFALLLLFGSGTYNRAA